MTKFGLQISLSGPIGPVVSFKICAIQCASSKSMFVAHRCTYIYIYVKSKHHYVYIYTQNLHKSAGLAGVSSGLGFGGEMLVCSSAFA